jgi:dihydroorotate dehydrogenase
VSFNYETLKGVLFRLSPEQAHAVAGWGLRALSRLSPLRKYYTSRFFVSHPMLRQELWGSTFLNPVGLGAGYDKNGQYLLSTPALGFGYTEIGTVTPKPQPGNDKPRLFRLTRDASLQNAMGFNNYGSHYMVERLKDLYFYDYPIGINIGKNKHTCERDALKDYETLLRAFKAYGTYIVINISSPNTPGLRDLQNEHFIKALFKMARAITDQPILLKIAPDITVEEALHLCTIAIEAGASGIIATNTTTDYTLSPYAKRFGGISGALLKEKSYQLFRGIARDLHDKTVLISVGGVDSAEEAYRRIRAGASLVQVYSMLIYRGPALIREINEGLVELLKADGYRHISEAIGAEWRDSQ